MSSRTPQAESFQAFASTELISVKGAEILARVAALEERGSCEPGFTVARVLQSCIVNQERRRGLKDLAVADRDQLRLGMPRYGVDEAPDWILEEYILQGKYPPRLWLSYMVGTAKTEGAFGATWCRGFGEALEIYHVGEIDFPLPERQRSRLVVFTEPKPSDPRDEMVYENVPDVMDAFNIMNLEYTAFVAACLNRFMETLFAKPANELPFGYKIRREDVSGISGFPITVRYTTHPNESTILLPWGEKLVDRQYGITDLVNPHTVAERTGLPVVSYPRQADMAKGNSGVYIAATLSEVELRKAFAVHGLDVCMDVNVGGNTNGAARNFSTGAAAANDFSVGGALVNWAVREFSGSDQKYDVDGAFAAQGTIIPELEGRIVSRYISIIGGGNMSGTEDWATFMDRVSTDFRSHHNFSVIRTIVSGLAKGLVVGIDERLASIVGRPQYCMEHGGMFKHPIFRKDFEAEMRRRHDTAMFELYSDFRPGADLASRENILCCFIGQEASVGNVLSSAGKIPAVMGTVV